MKIRAFLKKYWVLIKFYLLLIYLWILFYFLLHWPISRKYIAGYLPMFMAKNVALILNLIGIATKTNEAQVILPGFQFEIIYQCAGVFGMMIYIAAIIAFPSKWKAKIYGILLGIPVLYVVNMIRMTFLGIVGMKWKNLFDWFHEWMWQGIFIIFVVGLWLFWKDKFVKDEISTSDNR